MKRVLGQDSALSSPTPHAGWREKLLRALPWAGLVVLSAGSAIGQYPLLYKLGNHALCYADGAGFLEALSDPLPGGVLHFVASFFAICWSVPILGVCAWLALGVGVTLLARKWAKLPWLSSFLPLAICVWQVAYCGFSAYIFENAAFPQETLLCWGVVVFLMGVARRWGGWSLLGLALFPFAGMPAILGVALGACCGRGGVASRAVRLVACAGVVAAWQRFTPADPAWGTLLLSRLPFLVEEGALKWNAMCALVPVGLLGGALLAEKCRAFGKAQAKCVWGAGALVVASYGVCLFLGADPVHPLYDVLACERALARNDMARILRVPEDRVVRHRMLAAYRIHALWREGRLAEELFDTPWAISHMTSTIDTMKLGGYNLLYAYGIVQLARRWCYESVVPRGWDAGKYSLMARIAIVMREDKLARRYARQLARIPFHRKEAQKLLDVIAQRTAPDAELVRVGTLYARLCADPACPTFEGTKRLEEGIYNRYAVLQGGDRQMVELYLCASLLRKETLPFLENFSVICQVWDKRPLPRVFQQALLSAAASVPPEQQPHLTSDLFSPGMVEAFQGFRVQAERLSKEKGDIEKLMRPYRRSYWFYALFVQ